MLVERVGLLRDAFLCVKKRKPFDMNAVVIMPDHFHCIWTLPEGDADYSGRWKLLKGYFSRGIPKDEFVSQSRRKRRERGLWQRQFWGHMLIDQDDFNVHFDYIHWNPVKHGWVESVKDWPYSSFHRYVDKDVYSVDWRHSGDFSVVVNE